MAGNDPGVAVAAFLLILTAGLVDGVGLAAATLCIGVAQKVLAHTVGKFR